jgi:hypothetical protein
MKAVQLGRPSRQNHQLPENDNLFGWTIFILLLCGFALVCWIGTFYVFSHPEEPFAYQILTKLKKLDPPRRFELTAAPGGEFLGGDKLIERFGTLTASQLNDQSNDLLRAYLRNYDHQTAKVPYVTGKFTILDAYPLNENRFFNSGVVVIAQSVDTPTIYLEHVFPAAKEHLASMQHILTTGLGIELRRSYDLSAVIHVSSIGSGRLLFTCLPLLYGPYGTTQNGSGFQLDPPKLLNTKAGLPLVSQNQLRDAEQRYAEYRKAIGEQQRTTVASAAKAKSNGVEAVALVPVARALPVTTPIVAPLAKPSAKPSPTPIQVAAASPTPLAKIPQVTGTPPAVAANQPLQPFLTASPTPGTTGRVGSWQTYRPGQMPRGHLMDVAQTSELADRGIGNETLYLRGDFTVTAARENRAVLRPRQSLADRVLNRGNARVIVEYPRGFPTPREGESFQRGPERPFQIVDIRKGADGELNIYVREVTTTE